MNTWTTDKGDTLKLSEMTTPHIHNCIRMLERLISEGNTERVIGDMPIDWDDEPWADTIDIEPQMKEQIEDFKKELERRKNV